MFDCRFFYGCSLQNQYFREEAIVSPKVQNPLFCEYKMRFVLRLAFQAIKELRRLRLKGSMNLLFPRRQQLVRSQHWHRSFEVFPV